MIKRIGTKTITTKRLILRKFAINDTEDVFMNWANDIEVTRYLSWLPHGKLDVTKNIINAWVEDYKNPDTYNWGIELKNLGQVIGSISVIKFECKNLVCEIGYCLSKKYWNKGIMSEALKAVIGFLIDNVGVQRVYAYHNANNVASGKVMQKAGMQFEGKLRKYHLNREGALEDVNMYSMIDDDVLERKGAICAP